jgi:uncharacterized repeat protein (TIGR03803 family)
MRWKSCSKTTVVLFILAMALALGPDAWAGTKYSVLYKFSGGQDGSGPNGALVSDATGNLYGVTATGGDGKNGGCGTVFELSRVRNSWAQKVLYRFPGSGRNGCILIGNLAFDATGNLYGTASRGGQGDCSGGGCGTVFELKPNSDGGWKATVLHRFAGGNDGDAPSSGVVLDSVGNVYGTTAGGDTSCGCGTVFELTPREDGGWTKTTLHAFGGADGAGPSGLIFDAAGNLYGLASAGGAYGEGVAFELSPTSGGGWTENTIYNFEGFSDGAGPGSGLTFGGGNLYGATSNGGAHGWGTIFELQQGSNGWVHGVLYSFTGGKDGRYPASPFVFDKSGNLFGTTGGDVSCLHGNRWGCGNVFELMPESGGQWKPEVRHTFPGGGVGLYPSQVAWGEGGDLVGVVGEGGVGKCEGGGWSGCGLAFEMTP